MSTDGWVDAEIVVHIHNGILLKDKKKNTFKSVLEVDEHKAYYTKWSKSERERQIVYSTSIWNLERWYWWTYLEGGNGDTDIKNRLVGEKESGVNWENMETYIIHLENTTICKTDSKWEFALWHRELNPVLCDDLEG